MSGRGTSSRPKWRVCNDPDCRWKGRFAELDDDCKCPKCHSKVSKGSRIQGSTKEREKS